MKHPPPSHAATIWLAGNTLSLSMPSPIDSARNHMVAVEIDMATLSNLLTDNTRIGLDERKTLRSLYAILHTLRERALANKAESISSTSAPTQWDLDRVLEALAQGRVTKFEPKKSAPEDLSLGDLDL